MAAPICSIWLRCARCSREEAEAKFFWVQTAVEAVASGGKVVLVGMGQDQCTLNTGTTLVKELDLHGCFRCVRLPLDIWETQ